MNYRLILSQVSHEKRIIEVQADSAGEAEEKALALAGNPKAFRKLSLHCVIEDAVEVSSTFTIHELPPAGADG